MFASKEAQCTKCHGREGDGAGEEGEIYDDWNKPKKGDTPELSLELAERFTLPLQRLRPRDFRQGAFHGGSAPEDLYLRIYLGIPGTPMPAAGGGPGVPAALSPGQIWDVVSFVRSLSGDAAEDRGKTAQR
jgi:mono/diheme cytochrome c family protein